jgi:hypothetical protein
MVFERFGLIGESCGERPRPAGSIESGRLADPVVSSCSLVATASVIRAWVI